MHDAVKRLFLFVSLSPCAFVIGAPLLFAAAASDDDDFQVNQDLSFAYIDDAELAAAAKGDAHAAAANREGWSSPTPKRHRKVATATAADVLDEDNNDLVLPFRIAKRSKQVRPQATSIIASAQLTMEGINKSDELNSLMQLAKTDVSAAEKADIYRSAQDAVNRLDGASLEASFQCWSDDALAASLTLIYDSRELSFLGPLVAVLVSEVRSRTGALPMHVAIRIDPDTSTMISHATKATNRKTTSAWHTHNSDRYLFVLSDIPVTATQVMDVYGAMSFIPLKELYLLEADVKHRTPPETTSPAPRVQFSLSID